MKQKKATHKATGRPRLSLVIVFVIFAVVHYLVSFINHGFPTYEKQGYFQTIYLTLAFLAFLATLLGGVLATQQESKSWRIAGFLTILYGTFVTLISLLACATVNFFY